MSRPYLDKGLDEMIKNAEDALRKEQNMLALTNELFIRFRGDHDWVPTGEMHTEYDHLLRSNALQGTAAAKHNANTNGSTAHESYMNGNMDMTEDAMVEMLEVAAIETSESTAIQLRSNESNKAIASINGDGPDTSLNGTQLLLANEQQNDDDIAHLTTEQHEDKDEAEDDAPSHRMTTRAQLSAFNAPSGTPSPPPIHPFFKPPDVANLHPSFSNPEEDPLGPLLTYVSKQEEIVRLQGELYNGLLKAQRMRKEVFAMCKADGHVGEMSDGEDWVDFEEWGLQPGELVKGKEEDDNDNANAEGGGRRGRRGGRGAGDR
jgi:hypothetical protein